MLKYLDGIKWIGDISLEDADVLAQYGKNSKHVLEFGCGGSTHILAQCSESVTSVDTDQNWLNVTERRLAQLNLANPVKLLNYTTNFEQMFDLIFVDGVDELRHQFGTSTWQRLKVGCVMLFHDTKRPRDFSNALSVAQAFHNEILKIETNVAASNGKSSNITVIHKKANEPYVDWSQAEGKPRWSYGTLDGDHELWTYKEESRI